MADGLSGRRNRLPGPRKAREILRHGEVRGESLTEKQRGLFGLIVGGRMPTRMRKRRKRG